MPISLTQGLGAGLVNVAGAYQQAQQAAEDRRRKMEREDTQAKREDQVWQERGENQDVAGMAAEQNLLAHANDQDPFYQTEQLESQMTKDPEAVPAVENKPNPQGIATIKLPDGQVGPPAPATGGVAPQQVAPPAQAAPPALEAMPPVVQKAVATPVEPPRKTPDGPGFQELDHKPKNSELKTMYPDQPLSMAEQLYQADLADKHQSVQAKNAMTEDKKPEAPPATPAPAQTQPAGTQDPRVPPAGWTPKDPEAKALHDKYLARNKDIHQAMDKIHVAAGGDQAKEKRMLAAYAKLKQPELDKSDEEFKAYSDKVRAKIASTRATQFVREMYSALQSRDNTKIEAKYGPGARVVVDEASGLPGVKLPNGNFIGKEMAMADAMLQAKLIDGKEYGNMSMDYVKIYAAAIKEKEQFNRQMSQAGRNPLMESGKAVYDLTLK